MAMWIDNILGMSHATATTDFVTLDIRSAAFEEGGLIPSKYTCDGTNVNPPISISRISPNVKSLALIVDDPDAPVGTWVHWIAWNIPVSRHLPENKVVGTEGINDFQQRGYVGPCPPSGVHRYFFKVYALDTQLHLPPDTTKRDLEKSMREHIVGFGQLIGIYKRRP